MSSVVKTITKRKILNRNKKSDMYSFTLNKEWCLWKKNWKQKWWDYRILTQKDTSWMLFIFPKVTFQSSRVDTWVTFPSQYYNTFRIETSACINNGGYTVRSANTQMQNTNNNAIGEFYQLKANYRRCLCRPEFLRSSVIPYTPQCRKHRGENVRRLINIPIEAGARCMHTEWPVCC